MKRTMATIAATLAVLAIGGFLVAVTGVIPIKASSGHWPITEWFLKFSMSRSVSTHTVGIETPSLDDPGLIVKGATHYHIGCRPCHGSPSLHHPPIAAALTPLPPYLPETVSHWDPEELFYIVKHGVKFTGMPAWPTQNRDDEVWAVVAFLLRYPDLEQAEYQALVEGDSGSASDAPALESLAEEEESPPQIRDSCARCHGVTGIARPGIPHLAGQNAAYLEESLIAYAKGDRHSGIMQPVAAGLSGDEIARLAEFYAAQNVSSGTDASASQTERPTDDNEAALIEKGRLIAAEGREETKLPACSDCHGPTETSKNPTYPKLAGQRSDYLRLQLQLFKEAKRGGTRYSELMHPVATTITEKDIEATSKYYHSLPLNE